MKTTLLIGMFTLTMICVFGQETKTVTRGKVSIEYPSDWVLRDFAGYLILVSEPAGKELTFMSTFDIQVDTTFKTLDSFYNNYKKTMISNETFKSFKIKSKEKISFKGFSALEFHCTATAQDLPLEWKSIIFLKDNRIYKLTTTSLIGLFNVLEEKTNKIFDSFKIE